MHDQEQRLADEYSLDSSSYGDELSEDEPIKIAEDAEMEEDSKSGVNIKNKQGYFGGLIKNKGTTTFIEHTSPGVKRFNTAEFLDQMLGP